MKPAKPASSSSSRHRQFPDAQLPLTNRNWRGFDDNLFPKPVTRAGQLVLDGFDRKHKVAFEFVSREDFLGWQDPNSRKEGLASTMELRGTAEMLRSGLTSARHTPWIGVFYEPLAAPPLVRPVDWDMQKFLVQIKQAERAAEEEALRAQVRDFIAWLKAQGVI